MYPLVKTLILLYHHGFMKKKKRSTVTNLSIFSQYLADVLDNRGQLNVIYTDFE